MAVKKRLIANMKDKTECDDLFINIKVDGMRLYIPLVKRKRI